MSDGEDTRAERLEAALGRAHALEALVSVTHRPQEFLELVLAARDVEDATRRLRDAFGFSEVQALVVLDMQFRRMASLDRSRLEQQLDDVSRAVEELEDRQDD
jgi:DNA gyrase subunit A